MSVDIEQIIRAIFTADASMLTSEVAKIDASVDDATARIDKLNAKANSIGIDPKMADRMAKAQLAAAQVGETEIQAIERELRVPLSPNIAIPDGDLARMEKARLEADALSLSLAGKLPDAADATTRGLTRAGRSAASASGGVGKLWDSFKGLANILPGIGIGGLLGGVIAGIEELFSLVGGDQMDKFSRDVVRAAETVHGLALELGEAANRAAALYQDPNDVQGKIIEQRLKNAKALEREAKEGRNKDQIDAAHEEVVRLERSKVMHDASGDLAKAEMRSQSLQTSEYELNRKLLNSTGEIEDLGNKVDQFRAMMFDGAGQNKGLSESQAKAYAEIASKYNEAVDAKATAEFGLSQLPKQKSQAAELLAAAQEAVSFAGTYNPDDMKPAKISVDARNARITINERITTNDPGELAGATLAGAYRALVRRPISVPMMAPTGRP